jgi:hypothetical protein
MAWLVAAGIVVVFLLFLAGYRKSALGLFVAAVIAGFLVYQYGQRMEQEKRTRIKPSELVLEKVVLEPTFRSSYDLTGTISNKSESYQLDGISFRVTLRDCLGKDKASCTVIGEAETYVALTIPPQQTRSFTGSLYFGTGPIRVKGRLDWDYEIISITSRGNPA